MGRNTVKRDMDTELPPPCQPFQADGWCDTINNRAYCHYDGGDCCSSTLSSKKVSEGSGTRLEGGQCRDEGSSLGSLPFMVCAHQRLSSSREEETMMNKHERF